MPLFIEISNFLSVSLNSLTYPSVPDRDPTTLSLKKNVPIPRESGSPIEILGAASYPEPALVKKILLILSPSRIEIAVA